LRDPKVSVIIPTYNGADHLGATIQSVLDQTLPDFELFLVDDGSTDNTHEIVEQFDDPRIIFMPNESNRGADAARNTGLRRASADVIAFLDQDDLFHPEKLQIHVEYLAKHPRVGFTYNARYELHYSSENIREIASPPARITLEDIVLSHQLSPSEMVFRKDWVFRIGLLDESHNFHGGEIIFLGKLYLEGCRFANVNRVLNYRRYHAGRVYKNLEVICQDERDAQDKIFFDGRCPQKVKALRNQAHVNMYLYFICLAFAQNETSLGQKFITETIRLDPNAVAGSPCPLVESFLVNSIDDENKDHVEVLDTFFNQLPPEIDHLTEQMNWAVARGYFDKAVSSIIWGKLDMGNELLFRLAGISFGADDTFLQSLAYHLKNYKREFGSEATNKVLLKLERLMKKNGIFSNLRRLRGNYIINDAFHAYHNDRFSAVPFSILIAISYDFRHLTNRGVISIFLRSIFRAFPRVLSDWLRFLK